MEAKNGFKNGFNNKVGLKTTNDVRTPAQKPKHIGQLNKYPKKSGLILHRYSLTFLNILLLVTIIVNPMLIIM